MSEFKEKARQELVTFVQNSGLTRSESEVAINNCVNAITENAEKGFYAGVAIAALMNIPAPGIGGATAIGIVTAATSVKAAMTLKNSRHCSEVRSALSYWLSEKPLLQNIQSEQ
ncbi:hypothetical protein LZG74_10825 [Dyadobacter sp. CY327]|uniref:hypothetical protein n=1 Tax=Dyadobacter sp. CY327 TaxID=2907301 RepID=UPI001F432AA6|nr:hypothetical protein [Dyadobacter sp. CY327]MCE7070799.1 hypothetical protein [Dyadobacter sp. CY327]